MTLYKIGDLCTWSKGFQVPRDDTSPDKKVPYLHYGDLYKLYDFRLKLPEKYSKIIKIDDISKVKQDQYILDGDIVFTLTSETVEDLGHCTLIINPDNDPFVSGMETTVVHIRDRNQVNPAFLNYYFHNPRFTSMLQQYVTGMKVYRVHPDDLMDMEIDLPPIDVQKNIASMLDTMSDQIECKCKINDNLGGVSFAS